MSANAQALHAYSPAPLYSLFFNQLDNGVTHEALSTWSPLNRIAFASTYQLDAIKLIVKNQVSDDWLTGTLRNGVSFASPVNAGNRHKLDSIKRALRIAHLVGPYEQHEAKALEQELPVTSLQFRADADYLLNCDKLLAAQGSDFSRWRWYLRVAERASLQRVSLSNIATEQLDSLLDIWGREHGFDQQNPFDIAEMKDSFKLRNESPNIDGFGYFSKGHLMGITICDLSVKGVVNLLFMKTSKSVPFLSRLAIRDVAAAYGCGAKLNMGQDLNISGLRKFKSSLPTSEVMAKCYLKKSFG